MSGEIKRESFADEASWLEFQANQIALARNQRQRELVEQHAKAGRNYDIIKRINAKIRKRELARVSRRRRYEANPEQVHKQQRIQRHRQYWRHRSVSIQKSLAWYYQNRAWVLHRMQIKHAQDPEQDRVRCRCYYETHREWYVAYYPKKNARRRALRANNPEYRERENQRDRERRARKRAEKLALQGGVA